MKKVYLVETGILLDRSNPEYNCYNEVYDKKHSYYDTNQYLIIAEENTLDANNYLYNAAPNTYCVISLYSDYEELKQFILKYNNDLIDKEIDEEILNGEIEHDYSLEKVVSSAYVNDSDEIISNFIIK